MMNDNLEKPTELSEQSGQSNTSETVTESENVVETAAETKNGGEETKTDMFGIQVWLERLQIFKTVIIDLVILCIIFSLAFVFYNESQREPIVIEAFAVPKSLEELGYSGIVLNSRLMDQLSANREASYNRLPDNQKYLFPIEVTNSDLSDTLNIDIPETGMSLNTIIQYIRQLRGVETRISGDLVGNKDKFELTVRVDGKPKTVKGNLDSLDENLNVLAEYIIENTQPYFLALHYYGKKDYDKALALVQDTLNNKDKRDDSFAYDLWGNILARKKQYQYAIEKYNESIKINPDNDNPYIGLGFVYFKGYKNYKAAISNYQKVINRNDKNYSAYNDLALVLADNGDIKAATENYKKAIAANPNYANAYYNLGVIFLGDKNYREANVQFNKIIELSYNERNYFNAYNGLCYSLGQQGKYEEAIGNCELAIKIKPKDDNIYDTLGTVYFIKKDYDNAMTNYQTAINYNPDNSEAQQHLAEVLAITGKCDEANTHIKLALKLDDTADKKIVEKYCKNQDEKP